MLKELSDNVEVYLITGYTDMRKGIDVTQKVCSGKEMDFCCCRRD